MNDESPAPQPKYLVRHGAMRFIGEFAAPPAHPARGPDPVTARPGRGEEVGGVLCPATPQAVSAIPEPSRGDILRVATADDRSKLSHLKDVEKKEFAA